MPFIYETSLNDLEKMQPLFNGYEESVFFSISSLKSTPLDLRSVGKFDNRNALIPHVRCGDYSKKQTIETAHLAKEMRFKKVFLISGDPPMLIKKASLPAKLFPIITALALKSVPPLIFMPLAWKQSLKRQKKR